MGKMSRRKCKARRANPTDLPSMRDIEDEDGELNQGAAARAQHSIEELREMLQGSTVEDRECAACIIANLAKDDSSSESLLFDDSIIRTAAPLLLERNLAVRHSIAGALRNISAISLAVCGKLVEYDVMTPLVALLKQYTAEWRPTLGNPKIDSNTEVFYEAVHLLWNLCESSGTAVGIFNQERLLDILLPCIDVTQYGHRIATAVAHCLYAVSEDNSDMACSLTELKPFYALCEEVSKEPSAVLLKVLSAGILVNLAEEDDKPVSPHLLPLVITIVSEALSLPVAESIGKLTQMVADLKVQGTRTRSGSRAVREKEWSLELEVGTLLDALMAKQTALELLSNVCYGDGGSEAADEGQESGESSEGFEDDVDGMDVDDIEDTSQVNFMNMPCEAHEAIVSNQVVCKLMNHVSPIDVDVEATLKELPLTAAVPKRLKSVQCRSLLCIANLIGSLQAEDLGGASGLCSMWSCLAQLAFVDTGVPEDEELLEASTGACRSVLQSLLSATTLQSNVPSVDPPALPVVTQDELSLITSTAARCSDVSIRVNVVRIIASLACLLKDTHDFILRTVGGLLLDTFAKDNDINVVAEALDGLFDVFGEDSTASVAREIELLPKLRHILTRFNEKIKKNRKSLGSQYAIVMTAKTNLLRFIAYKSETATKNGNA